jgi:hypothetical protein
VSEGGWRAFREASKRKATTETAADELERPVSHRITTQLADGEAAELASQPAPETEDEPPPEIAAWSAPVEKRPGLPRRIASRLKRAAHWYVLAIVPVAAAASLMAVRAGVNPYALCLEWWDILFATVFLTACVLFLILAVWKGSQGNWHPGAGALIVAVGVLPFWVGINAAFGSACREISQAPLLLPPLPPPIEVPNVPKLWPAPLPMPRPSGL